LFLNDDAIYITHLIQPNIFQTKIKINLIKNKKLNVDLDFRGKKYFKKNQKKMPMYRNTLAKPYLKHIISEVQNYLIVIDAIQLI
jgi:hypothetical protein